MFWQLAIANFLYSDCALGLGGGWRAEISTLRHWTAFYVQFWSSAKVVRNSGFVASALGVCSEGPCDATKCQEDRLLASEANRRKQLKLNPFCCLLSALCALQRKATGRPIEWPHVKIKESSHHVVVPLSSSLSLYIYIYKVNIYISLSLSAILSQTLVLTTEDCEAVEVKL